MNNSSCIVCKNDKYLNPNLKFKLSEVCFHSMCVDCIDRIFTVPSPCPICKILIRKQSFIFQTFQDLSVEKEIIKRRKISKIYNLQQNDFVNLNEFNKYLQEKEDLVFDFDEFKINEFKLKNKEIIKQNQLILLKKDLFEKSKINQEIAVEF